MTGWTVRGTTTDVTHCEICGRRELLGTVHLVTADGEEIYAGTTCAARKAGTTAATIRGAVKSAALRAEILEGHFRDYFSKAFGASVNEWVERHGDAGREGVESVRKQWMRKG